MSITRHSQVAQRYAEALFTTVTPAHQSEIAEEFKQVLNILNDPKINDVLHHPKTSKERKGKLVKLMSLSPIMENFLLLIVEKSRENLLPSIEHYFEQLALDAQQKIIAEVVSAVPLTKETLESLELKLARLTGKTVLLQTKLNSSIGGGMIIKVDGQVIDGSVNNTLKQFERSLTN